MTKLPKEIQNLMNSNAYKNSSNKNHNEVANKVSDWFNDKYANSVKDETGKNYAIRKVWKWHAYDDEKTCDECATLSGQIFEDRGEIPDQPHHPNCRCWIEELNKDDNDRDMEDFGFKQANDKTSKNEGGYVDDPRLIDQPTNMGVIQPTLNDYNKSHPNYNFPKDIRNLTREQADQIYHEKYYTNRKINEIINPRIRDAIYDMGVMSNFNNVVKTTENTLNKFNKTSLQIKGAYNDTLRQETIDNLNNISSNEIDNFMDMLKDDRLDYLKKLGDWEQFEDGWTSRTKGY
ncbi:MAG: hypothetical protein LBU68_01275 [Rickettsiales bacterium]|jgi:hypothetical protein|nr:hypothetical protein [Rickettsiales bacterium]